MTTHKPFISIMSSLTRPSIPLQHICRPCQRQLQVQFQQRSQQQPQDQTQIRALHRHVKAKPVPEPTPFVPDASTFLTLIGRGLSTHASKIESWKDLFTLSSPQLKEIGIEPARTRRYLLRWREKFRKGEYGIGGDFKYVTDGQGELRVVEVPALPEKRQETTEGGAASISQTPGMTKLVLNVPQGSPTYMLERGQTTQDLKKPAYVTLRDGHVIAGSYIQPVKESKGSVATLKVAEGLWEDKRGRKVFGGERRRAETLHKMRVAERKKNAR